MASFVSEALCVSYLLTDFNLPITGSVELYCDNQSTIQMLHNPTHHERTKQIDIDCHFARTHVATGFVQSRHIDSKNQLGDIFTKALGPSLFYSLLFQFNLSCHSVKFEGGVKNEGLDSKKHINSAKSEKITNNQEGEGDPAYYLSDLFR